MRKNGPELSHTKTEVISCRVGRQEKCVCGWPREKLNQPTSFKSLRSVISELGGCEEEVRCIVKAAWNKWIEPSGIAHDKEMTRKLKVVVHKEMITQ